MRAILHDIFDGKQKGSAMLPEGTRPDVIIVERTEPGKPPAIFTFVYSHSQKDPDDKQGERICHYRECRATILKHEQRLVHGAGAGLPPDLMKVH